jgi:hypothetical protein
MSWYSSYLRGHGLRGRRVPVSCGRLQTRGCAPRIVDRLTFGGNIIETGTDSYQLAHTRAHQGGTAT